MTGTATVLPEVKGTDDINEAFGEFLRSFEHYRAANDDRLQALERNRGDVLAEEKLARIDEALDRQKTALDRLLVKAERPQLGRDGRTRTAAELEHRAAFEAYMRAGREQDLRRLEEKALSVGSGADGGYTVTPELDREIGRRLNVISPIRAIATVRTVSTNVFQKPFATTVQGSGWVSETGTRSTTSTPTLAALTFQAMELYAMPACTQALLDDSAVDIDQWLIDEIEQVFATQEGTAFVTGDGTNKPKGFAVSPVAAEAAWTWGKIGYVATGVSAGFAATNPADKLIDLVYTLKAGYRQNASFVMNRRTQAVVRKMKDSNGDYLWKPPLSAEGRSSLIGMPVVEAEDMPDIAADSVSIAFGDFKRGYLIVDRVGTRVLRDPYSSKPYVLFYTTKRVGGGVQDFDAIKFLKFGTS